MNSLSLTYSLADQEFARTKSIGIFNVSLQLAMALAREPRLERLTVLANRRVADSLSALPAKTNVVMSQSAIGGRLERIIWDQWRVYSEARKTTNAWLLLPKGFASFLRKPPVHLAAYVHDMMHEVYATRYPGQSLASENPYFRRSMMATLRNARLIFTNTEFTAEEVRRVAKKYGLKEPRVRCIGIGFERGATLNLPREDRIVVLTSRLPHKRSDLAIQWLQRWQDESRFDGFIELVGSLPGGVRCPARVGWLHWERLAEHSYRELLHQSRVLAYFSDHEGFGMPPVEAVMAGVCPVYTSLPPTREAMGETGCAFSNSDYSSFAAAMNAALRTPPKTIEHWADSLLQRHRWDLVAQRAVSAMLEAA